jgi:hypothetical protein
MGYIRAEYGVIYGVDRCLSGSQVAGFQFASYQLQVAGVVSV